jgi:hypothetical protein
MTVFNQYNQKVLEETDRQQIIEIPVPGVGQTVSFDVETLTEVQDIIGVALVNPAPLTCGHGTLRLRIGDEEIFPNGFHADLISKYIHRQVTTKLEFGFKEYIFPLQVKAQGKPARIQYTEPADGGKGSLFLYLLGKNNSGCIGIPALKFQVIDIDVPKGSNAKDIEIPINEKTLQSHKKVTSAMFLAPSNRLKQVKLCVDESTIFPEGMHGQLVTKEMVTKSSATEGIFTKHIIPFQYLLYTVNMEAKNSKIEGRVWATPNPDNDYKIYLYLMATI